MESYVHFVCPFYAFSQRLFWGCRKTMFRSCSKFGVYSFAKSMSPKGASHTHPLVKSMSLFGPRSGAPLGLEHSVSTPCPRTLCTFGSQFLAPIGHQCLNATSCFKALRFHMRLFSGWDQHVYSLLNAPNDIPVWVHRFGFPRWGGGFEQYMYICIYIHTHMPKAVDQQMLPHHQKPTVSSLFSPLTH